MTIAQHRRLIGLRIWRMEQDEPAFLWWCDHTVGPETVNLWVDVIGVRVRG